MLYTDDLNILFLKLLKLNKLILHWNTPWIILLYHSSPDSTPNEQ